MKQISQWEASNGKVFKTQAEAARHEEWLNLSKWYDNEYLWAEGVVPFDEVADWLHRNQRYAERMIAIVVEERGQHRMVEKYVGLCRTCGGTRKISRVGTDNMDIWEEQCKTCHGSGTEGESDE